MASIPGIRAVFFDLYNTVARFWPPVERIQTEACSRLGITVSAEGIAVGYLLADAYMSRENAHNPVRNRSRDERRAFFGEYERLVLEGAGVEADVDLARRVWREVQRIPYALALFDDALPALDRLRSQGIVVGIISNVDRSGDELQDALGLRLHIDFLLTSREVGEDKPHPPVFLAALGRARVAPPEAVHVGDQVDTDIVGALNTGIHPVFIDRTQEARPLRPYESGPPEGVPIVRSLTAVVDLVA